MFPWEKKILARVYPSVRPSVGGFFICNKISDGKGSYRRLLYRWTCSVGEAVGNYSPTELIPGTDRISPSVKIFNSVVNILKLFVGLLLVFPIILSKIEL